MSKANLQAKLEEDERKRKEEALRRAAQQTVAAKQQREAAKAAVKQVAASSAAAQQYRAAAAAAAQKQVAEQTARAAAQAAQGKAMRKLQQGQKLTGAEADRAYDAVNSWLENGANRAAYQAVQKAERKGGNWAANLYQSGQFTKQQLDTAKMYQDAYQNLGLGTKLQGRVGDTLAGVGLNIAGSAGLAMEALSPLAGYRNAAEDAARLGKNLATNQTVQAAANQNTANALAKVLANETPVDKNAWAYQTWLEGQQRQQRGALGLNDAQKMLQGAAASAAENLALATINPALVMPTLTMQAAGGSVAESAERGDSLAKTLGKATATGAIGALVEKLPTDELMRNLGVKPGAAQDALTGLLRQAGAEGLEELIESYAGTAVDAAFGDEAWSKLLSAEQLQEALQAGAQGALAGGMMGGGAQMMSRAGRGAQQNGQAEAARLYQAALAEAQNKPTAEAAVQQPAMTQITAKNETPPAGKTTEGGEAVGTKAPMEAEDPILQLTAAPQTRQTTKPHTEAKPGTDVWAERMAELFSNGKQMQQAFEQGAALPAEQGRVRAAEGSVLRDDKTAAKLIDLNSRSSRMTTEVREKLESNAYGAVEVQLGRMLVSDEAQADLVGTLMHEDYHWFGAWNREGGAELAKTMMEYMAQTHGSETVEALVNDYLSRYAEAGQELTYAKAVEEMTGDALRGIFDSEKSLRSYIKFCQTTASDNETPAWNGVKRVFKALQDFVDRLGMKLKEYLKIDPDNTAAQMASEMCEERKEMLRRLYREMVTGAQEAMDEAGETAAKPEAEVNTRQKIRRDVSGKPFVDITEDILKNVASNDAENVVKTELSKRYPYGIMRKGWRIQLTNKGVREFTRSRESQSLFGSDESTYRDKMRMAANLDEIIQVGENLRNEAPKHSRKDKLQAFNRADVRIRVGGRDYSAEIVTGIYPDKKEIFYDIVKLTPTVFATQRKKLPSDGIVEQNATRQSEETASNKSIAQSSQNDNTTRRNQLRRQPGENDHAELTVRQNELTEKIRAMERQKRELIQGDYSRLKEQMLQVPGGLMARRQWRETNPEWQAYEQKKAALNEQLEALYAEKDQLAGELQQYMDEDAAKAQKKTDAEQAAYDRELESSGQSRADFRRSLALAELGATEQFEEAGYLLPDGQMLNFADSGEPGKRSRDHREIQEYFGPAELTKGHEGVAAMNAFIADGNVRVMAESPGVDIAAGVKPTRQQLRQIARMADELGRKQRSFSVDVSDADGKNTATKRFEGRVDGRRVVREIERFYETGSFPQESELNRFRYQLKPNGDAKQAVADRKLGVTMAKLADSVYGADEDTRVLRVDEATGALLRRWNSKTDRRALNDRLGQLFSQSRPELSEEEAREECRRVAEFVLDGATRQNRELWEQYPELHKQTLTVPKDSKLYRELVYKYGSYAEAQKKAAQHGVTLRQGEDAMPWDTLQKELHKEYPNFFDGEATSGADLLQQMMNAHDNIKPWRENEYGESYEDAAEELTEQLYRAYEQSEDADLRSLLESAPADASPEETALREQLRELKRRQDQQRYTGKQSQALERLRKSWTKLYQMYMRPTETSHIPNVGGLREMTGELLALLDPGSMGTDKQGIQLRSAEEWEQKIKLVQEKLAEAKQSVDSGRNGELGDYLSGREIAEVREALDALGDILNSENAYENVTQYSGHTARQMTLEARNACIQVMTLLETKIRDANRSLTAGFARDMAKARLEAAGEVSSGEVNQRILGGAATERNAKYTEYLSPQRMFNRLGGYRRNSRMNQLYDLLNDAAVDTETYKQQGNNYFSKLAEKEGVLKQFALKAAGESSKAAGLSLFTGKKAEKLKVRTNLIDGSEGEVAVTRAILANMVDVWKHNKEEVEASGFTIPKLDLYYEGKLENAYAQGTQVYPTAKQLAEWEQMCSTGAAADWMEAMTAYEGWVTPIKASVQEAVDGFTNIRNHDHRTIYRDSNFVVTDSDADMRDSALRHFGFTKYRQKGAVQPIRAMDITDYAAKQVKDDSTYCGMTKAVRDFTKIYDGKLVNEYKDQNGRRRSAPSLKALIAKHYGQTANDYIKNLLQDLKGTPRAGGSPLLDKMLGNLAGSALSMNFYSTPVKQLSGFWAGASVMGMKHMLGTVGQQNRKYALKAGEIAAYTPLLAIRDAEGGSPELAALHSKKGRIGRINEQLPGSKAIGKMDSWVIERMWGAAAAKVHEENPDLGENTEAFKRATAKVFNRAVQETQSNNLVMQRSEMLRSKNAMYRILGQFKSQPMVNGNLILDAWAGLQANKSRGAAEQAAARKKFAETMVSQAATVLTDVALVNLVRAIMHQYSAWKDEDEEITVQSVLACLMSDGAGSIAGMVPGLDILLDVLSGYDYSNVTTDMVNDLKDACVDVYKAVDKYHTQEGMTLSETVQACVKPLCTGLDAFGIPASSTRRFAEAIGKWVNDIAAQEFDIDGKAGAYGTDLYSQLFAQRKDLGMNGLEVQQWYAAYGGKKDGRPTTTKRETVTYYQNRTDDENAEAVDENLNEMYLALFASYKADGMDAGAAHTAAAKVLPAKELTEAVSLPDADGDGKAEKVTLTVPQVVSYAEAKTEASYELYGQLFASSYSQEKQAEIAAKVDDYADAVATRKVLGEDPGSWYDVVFEAMENGASELDALAMVLFTKNVAGDKDSDGKTVSGSTLQNQLEYLKGQKIPNRQKAAILYGVMSDSKQAWYDKAIQAGADPWVTVQYLVFCGTVHGDDRKKQVQAEIARLGVTGKVKQIYLEAAGYEK